MIAQEPLTSVRLVFYRDRLEHWPRFGRDAGERILDRRRRPIVFALGAVFAFVPWHANNDGTVLSRIDIQLACGMSEPGATVPGVRPGDVILLRLPGWARVQGLLALIDAVEQAGVEAADVARADRQEVHHTRLRRSEQPRPYVRDQHRAWLLRHPMMAS